MKRFGCLAILLCTGALGNFANSGELKTKDIHGWPKDGLSFEADRLFGLACVATLIKNFDAHEAAERELEKLPDQIVADFPDLFMTPRARASFDKIATALDRDDIFMELLEIARSEELSGSKTSAAERALKQRLNRIIKNQGGSTFNWKFEGGQLLAKSTASRMQITLHLWRGDIPVYTVRFVPWSRYSDIAYTSVILEGQNDAIHEAAALRWSAGQPVSSQLQGAIGLLEEQQDLSRNAWKDAAACFRDNEVRKKLETAAVSEKKHERIEEIYASIKSIDPNVKYECKREGCSQKAE